jgi:diguanylate cyclase (GGDEF)-like protein/PAS domain S-box-containing protein
MHAILTNTLYLLAGISIYAAFSHFVSGMNKPIDRANIVFAWVCLLVAVAAISRSFVIQSANVDEYITALKWNVSASLGVISLLPWFIGFYTGLFAKRYLASVSLLLVLCITANLYLPLGISFSEIDALRVHHLPWGETVSHGVGAQGPFAFITLAAVVTILGRILYDLLKTYGSRKRRSDLHMIYAFGLFSIFTSTGILIRFSVLQSFSPGVFGFLVVIIAISVTLTKEWQYRLRASENRFRTLIEQSPIGIALSKNGLLLDANPIFLQMHGQPSLNAVLGLPLTDSLRLNSTVNRSAGKPDITTEQSFEAISRREDGSEFPVYVSTRNVELNGESLLVVFMVDQTKYKESEARIEYLARYDTLTGLPNRNLLIERLQQATSPGGNTAQWGALLLIDLNNFRILNDSLGHDIGDLLLKNVAKRLTNHIRAKDTAARLGGDEFVVLLEGLGTNPCDAAALAEVRGIELLETLNRPFQLGSHVYHNTSSVGISMFDGDGVHVEELFKQAELAMYQAKNNRSSNLRFFNPHMQDAATNRLDLESELRKAIENKGLYLHYQAQVDADHHITGAEALLRWQHPGKGLISPAHFIPLAEETGLILPLGHWLLDEACLQLRRWQDAPATRHLVLAINISAKQFRQPDFTHSIQEALNRHGVDPARLKLELTESMLFEHVEETIQTMSALKTVGVKFALDDFGTGYSSIQYLKHLPLDELKIDQSFVRDITSRKSDETIVHTVIAMADAMKLEVIAEGVETLEQMHLLTSLGCERFQGFLFGKPLAAEHFAASVG